MAKKAITDVVKTIVEELTSLESDERKRAVQAALMILGEDALKPQVIEAEKDNVEDAEMLPARVRIWMRQNDLSFDEVQQAFHIESGAVEFIGEIPGKTNKVKVRNAYILTGISAYLLTGEQRFDDVVARALCSRFGIYDHTNHSKYLKGGNEFTGSRERGWTLTNPGLKAGANLIKEVSSKG